MKIPPPCFLSPGSWNQACRVLLCLAMGFFLGAATGCLKMLEHPPMDRVKFALKVDYPDRPPPRQGPVLTVRLFESAPAFENQEFIYRLSALRWQTDYYHVFAQPPATLLTFEVRRWMVHSGLFRAVAIPGLGPAEAWQLQGFVTQMYGDFKNPDRPEAVLHLRCAFLLPGVAMEALFTKTYRQRVPLRVNTPEGLVEAWNQAIQRILPELTADVAQALRQNPPPPPPAQSEPAKKETKPFSLFPSLFQRQPNLAAPASAASSEKAKASPSPRKTPEASAP